MSTPNAPAAHTIVCTECNHQSTFPKAYLSLGARKSFTYFCGNCGTVTLHSIHAAEAEENTSAHGNVSLHDPYGQRSGSAAPSYSDTHGTSTTAPVPVGGANQHVMRGPTPASAAESEELSTAALWAKLEQLLAAHHVPMADLFRCDDATRMSMFPAIGITDTYEQQRLLILTKEREPQPQSSAAPTPVSAGASTPSAQSKGGLNTSSFGLYGQQGPPLAPASPSAVAPTAAAGPGARSSVVYGGWKPSQGPRAALQARPPSMPGVYKNGENMVARCSVYPELPAEFWCCACNVLVSSRCHVQGIHKDHPFVSMRLAAETHVRDTAAWADRCRTQLNITNTVIGNLNHSHGVLDQAVAQQFDSLDRSVEQMIADIYMWRDQLKSDVAQQVAAEHSAIEQASQQAQALHELYAEHLREAEPLLGNMPPAHQHDGASDDWALKFLDFVTRLKQVSAEPVSMPKVLVPEIRCTFATPMVMDMLKHVSSPINIRLPDLIDPGYFHFPHPTTSTRTPFVLAAPQDARQKGVVVENGRTLTRAPEAAPSHTLVTGSQIFYSGTTSWEVHVDKVGHGIGRVLAGVIIQGSDGEGVVWDGYRIVGPNEGESRTISEKFRVRPGTVLRFVLELDAPNSYLNCFFEREGVARIPLPPASSGWVPAFSVFGPQDQITIVPTQGAGAMEGSIPKGGGIHPALAAAAGQPDLLTRAKLEQQDLVIASLQKQLETITSKIDSGEAPIQHQQNHQQLIDQRQPSASRVNRNHSHSAAAPSASGSVRPAPSASAATSGYSRAADAPMGGGLTPGRIATPSQASRAPTALSQGQGQGARTASSGVKGLGSQYSPELAQLLKFVDEIK